MFNITPSSTANDRSQDYRNATLALASWFVVNNLRTRTPDIDPVLAKIYFDTYCIAVGDDINNIKEAASEYEPDIIRFFLLNQRDRCLKILDEVANIFQNVNIVLPIQCKPFFEEMMNLSGSMQQHNIQTKETQVLDSLRDTIIANSLNEDRFTQGAFNRAISPEYIPVNTSGKYILTDDEKISYLGILQGAIRNHYLPITSGATPTAVPNVYAMTDLYEDSGTRFAKVIEYLKSALFMICISYDERLNCGHWISPSIVPSIQDDMFGIIENLSTRCRSLEGWKDNIEKECARYGGFTIPQAICLPVNTKARLDYFKPEKNAISLTYKFLVCQTICALLSYKTKEIQHA